MSAEFRATERDLRTTAHLATFHSEKTLSAMHLALFQATEETGRLPLALRHMRAAADAWEQIVDITDGVYHDNLVFGISKDTPRSRLGQHHSGHWKDRLAEVRHDVADLERLVKERGGVGETFRTLPGEIPLDVDLRIDHTPITTAKPGEDLLITARVRSAAPIKRVVLHFRRLDQTADWKEQEMSPGDDEVFSATIPAGEISAQWDTQYYLEVLFAEGGRNWPSWENGPPYFVIHTLR
jgi:hypothetical protein